MLQAQSYLIAIDVIFCFKHPKRYTNFTHRNENKGRGYPYARYARASLKKSKVKNKKR